MSPFSCMCVHCNKIWIFSPFHLHLFFLFLSLFSLSSFSLSLSLFSLSSSLSFFLLCFFTQSLGSRYFQYSTILQPGATSSRKREHLLSFHHHLSHSLSLTLSLSHTLYLSLSLSLSHTLSLSLSLYDHFLFKALVNVCLGIDEMFQIITPWLLVTPQRINTVHLSLFLFFFLFSSLLSFFYSFLLS